MHNAGFTALGLPYTYVAFKTTDTDFAIQAMRKLGIRGYSLTIPHKERGSVLVDRLSVEGRRIGAINTVVNDGNELVGYNTDCLGIDQALLEAGVDQRGKRVLVLGAGGAARAAVYCAVSGGAGEVIVYNRTPTRAESLARDFNVKAWDYTWTWPSVLSETDLLINAAPIGMTGDNSSVEYPFPLEILSSRYAVFDMVTRETALLAEARKKRATVIPGSRMLLFQALGQFQLFTGENAPLGAMESALMSALAE